MLGFKSLWTTRTDWILTWKSLVQTYSILPRLIVFNSPFIAVLLVLEAVYSYWIFQKMVYAPTGIQDLMKSAIKLSFSVLAWTFLVFLVSYFLYNKTFTSKTASLVFRNFIKDNIWPIVVESLKVFFVLMGYAIGGLLSVSLLTFFTALMITQSLGGVLGLLDNALLGLVAFVGGLSAVFKSTDSVIILILFLIALTPSAIKAVQYLLMPYVVFFHKNFKNNSLALSSRASHGIVIPMAVVLIAINTVYQPVSSLIGFLKPAQLLHIGIDSLLRMLINIICIAVIYFMYVQKDHTHIK